MLYIIYYALGYRNALWNSNNIINIRYILGRSNTANTLRNRMSQVRIGGSCPGAGPRGLIPRANLNYAPKAKRIIIIVSIVIIF